jgi:hypothetical protein
MEVRLVDFFRAYPFGDGPADAVVAEFERKVGRQQALVALEQDGVAAREAQVGKHNAVRQELIHVPLRHLAGVAASLEGEHPELAVAIGKSVRSVSGQKFLAAVRSVIATVQGQTELLRAHGMSEETLPLLTSLLGEYEQALSATNAGRRAHTGAREEMRTLAKELMVLVKQLDGLVIIHFRDRPDVLGAWKSARNIAWPVTEPAKPAVVKPVIVQEESTSR